MYRVPPSGFVFIIIHTFPRFLMTSLPVPHDMIEIEGAVLASLNTHIYWKSWDYWDVGPMSFHWPSQYTCNIIFRHVILRKSVGLMRRGTNETWDYRALIDTWDYWAVGPMSLGTNELSLTNGTIEPWDQWDVGLLSRGTNETWD